MLFALSQQDFACQDFKKQKSWSSGTASANRTLSPLPDIAAKHILFNDCSYI
jgi:hypothetical protein